MSPQQKKVAIAKLYNHKSFIEGKIAEIDADCIDLDGLCKSIIALSGKLVDDLQSTDRSPT